MAHRSHKCAEEFQALDNLRITFEQEGLVKNFTQSQVNLSGLLATFSAVRQGSLDGKNVTIDDDAYFWDLMKLWGDLVLVLIPEDVRESLRLRAADEAVKAGIPKLSEMITPFAKAELTLRTLTLLVLEHLSSPFTGETRLPDWDRALHEARNSLEVAHATWGNLATDT
jgi:hypothetical protein